MEVDVDSLPPGHLIEDGTGRARWRVEKRIGIGGFGIVYRVKDVDFHTPRALKILRRHRIVDPAAREAFVREARVTGRFEGVARSLVVDVQETGILRGSEAPWILMELLQGRPLNEHVRGRKLTHREVLAVMFDLATVLAEAGRLNLVHRDLKPENLFVQQVGHNTQTKVVDFGLAVVMRAQGGAQDARVVGTPRYMAPEQFGRPDMVGPKTDVWPFGLIAYYCLTGTHFFGDDTNWERHGFRILNESLPSASEVSPHPLPQGFDAWLARCLARSSGDRPEPMQAVAALAEILGEPLPSVAEAPGEEGAAGSADDETKEPVSLVPPVTGETPSSQSIVPPVETALRATVFQHGRMDAREVRAVLRRIATALDQRRRAHPDAIPRVTDIRLQRLGDEWNVNVEASGAELQTEHARSRTIAARVDEVSCLPPEVFHGGISSGPSDAWILAMVAYRLLVGATYFQVTDLQSLHRAVDAPPRPASQVAGAGVKLPRGFDPWFARCTQRDAAKRPPDAVAAARQFPKSLGAIVAPVALLGVVGLAGLGVQRYLEPAPVALPPGQRWVRVAVPAPFEVFPREVTCGDFKAFQRALSQRQGGVAPSLPPSCEGGAVDDQAVGSIDFDSARRFCAHYGGDLPTLAQWRAAVGDLDAHRARLQWPERLRDFRVEAPQTLQTLVIDGDTVDHGGQAVTGLISGVDEWIRPSPGQPARGCVGLSPRRFSEATREAMRAEPVGAVRTMTIPSLSVGFRCVREGQRQ